VLSQNQGLKLVVTPKHFQENWRLSGSYDRKTNELIAVALLPPGSPCQVDAKTGYCLLLLSGSVQESLKLRGVTRLEVPMVWTFDRQGQTISLQPLGQA
jgi:hypothetical protein